MITSKQHQLFKALHAIESQFDYLRDLIHDAIPPTEWLTTKEFAERANLQHRTVTNYAGKGRFEQYKRLENGKYIIHISELEKWGK